MTSDWDLLQALDTSVDVDPGSGSGSGCSDVMDDQDRVQVQVLDQDQVFRLEEGLDQDQVFRLEDGLDQDQVFRLEDGLDQDQVLRLEDGLDQDQVFRLEDGLDQDQVQDRFFSLDEGLDQIQDKFFGLDEVQDQVQDGDQDGDQDEVQDEVQDKFVRLDEGLDLVLTQNPRTLKSVGLLVLGVSRMKKCLGGDLEVLEDLRDLEDRGDFGDRRDLQDLKDLRDAKLCSAIMEGLVTETVVERSDSSPLGGPRVFSRVNSGNLCTLSDFRQKDVVHNETKLQAVTLQGGHGDRKVNFKLARYFPPCVTPGGGQTVTLSITNKLHISCCMKDGHAQLNMEECSSQQLQCISGTFDRFLFIKRSIEVSFKTFESVLCPGWFISTAYDQENQPLEMCRVDTAYRLTRFRVKSQD